MVKLVAEAKRAAAESLPTLPLRVSIACQDLRSLGRTPFVAVGPYIHVCQCIGLAAGNVQLTALQTQEWDLHIRRELEVRAWQEPSSLKLFKYLGKVSLSVHIGQRRPTKYEHMTPNLRTSCCAPHCSQWFAGPRLPLYFKVNPVIRICQGASMRQPSQIIHRASMIVNC